MPDDSPDGTRCDRCPLTRLDAAQSSEAGQLLRRTLDLRAAIKVGVTVTLDDIAADEFLAMLILEEEREKFEAERNR